eukprot:TRINITY_DN24456_c0_g1_i1.p1 TRINITY_DN24456_c0_g1~~TRINITY_DN24456_c0_g1_i1.p1  ORF type:complete len:297 (-),score=19.99 TRINITY_DN24456_c0_g1_i1:111-1001(-)
MMMQKKNSKIRVLSAHDHNIWPQLTHPDRLAGKVALITGAASGIGKATATEFIRNGAKVIIADIQRQPGEEAATELGPDAAFIHCDVTQESDVSAAVDYAISKHGHLDIMYNNAGVSGSVTNTVADLNLEEFDRVMSINVRGVITGIKHAARVMVPRQTGCILCTASITGISGGISHHSYSISKFTVAGIVKSTASELCRHGIRVNCISPAAVPTPMVLSGVSDIFPGKDATQIFEIMRGSGTLKGVDCDAIDIAKAALYLVSDDGRYVSGHNLVVDGGFTSFKTMELPAPEKVVK